MRMNLIEAAFFNVTEVAKQHDFELDFNWMMKNTLASLSGNRNINRKRLKHAKNIFENRCRFCEVGYQHNGAL